MERRRRRHQQRKARTSKREIHLIPQNRQSRRMSRLGVIPIATTGSYRASRLEHRPCPSRCPESPRIDLQFAPPWLGRIADPCEQMVNHRQDGERSAVCNPGPAPCVRDFGANAPLPVPGAGMMAACVPGDAKDGKPVLEYGDLHAKIRGYRGSRARRNLREQELERAHGGALHHHPLGRKVVLVAIRIREVLDVLLALLRG